MLDARPRAAHQTAMIATSIPRTQSLQGRSRRRVRSGARAIAPRSVLGGAVVVCGLGGARRDPQLRERLARLVGARLLLGVVDLIAARPADDRAQEHEKKSERQPGQSDADALCAAASLVRHRFDEAMSHFDIMQADALTAAPAAVKGPKS